MNSLNWGNEIWPYIPSLQQIKNRLVANVYYIVSKNNDWKDKIKVRVWQKWESEQSKTYDIQNYIDKVWSETQMILEILEKKDEFLKSKITKESLFSKTGSIKWIHIIEKRWQLTFLIHLDNWKESKESTKKINQENFETIFYSKIEKFLKLRKELGMDNLSNNEIIKLTTYIDYYKKDYENKLAEKKLKEGKISLIDNWLVSQEGIILSINNSWNTITYKSNVNNNIITKTIGIKSEQDIINQFITTFVIQNWYEMWGDIHNWLKEKKNNYTYYFTKKEKNKSQKNSNVW